MSTLEQDVRALAERARTAATALALTDLAQRNAALGEMAEALRRETPVIIEANEDDMERARKAGTSESILDRLRLDEGRIESMAVALEDLIALPDPLGCIQESRRLYNGIELERISVPLGVVAVVYEARPNVTADAAGICIKSGNACILRGGSMAAASNEIISRVLSCAAAESGLPDASVQAITSTDRAATDVLMGLHGLVDVLIPRGGAGLIQHCVEHSQVPVIETGTGNCHVYVHESADPEKALAIVVNAKCRRYGVCNAAETLLIDESVASSLLPALLEALTEQGVTIHGDTRCADIMDGTGIEIVPATEVDWETEYLAPDIAVKCVNDVSEAVDHINRYGTRHSESIVAENENAIEEFLRGVDAAAVYANASTAFTDGGQFGMGAEIGISTQKLHVRGPFALEALTSYKYLLRGSGQVRS